PTRRVPHVPGEARNTTHRTKQRLTRVKKRLILATPAVKPLVKTPHHIQGRTADRHNPIRRVLEPVATFLPQVGALGLTNDDLEGASEVAGLGGDVNRRPDLALGCVGVSVSEDDDISSGLADCVVASLSPRRPTTVDLLKPQLPPEFFGHLPPSQAMRARRVDPRCEDLHVVTALVGFPSPATESRPGGKALGTEAHHNLPRSGSHVNV